MNFNNFLNLKYILSEAHNSTYEGWYLSTSLALVIFSIAYLIFCKATKRIPAYKKFDKNIFWGYLIIGLFGLFIWFSRNQSLPTFSIRAYSYAWLLSIVLYALFILYYFLKKLPLEKVKHYEKNRKERYLKK